MMGKPKPQDSFRLLLVEVLYRGKFFKNKEYKKKATSQPSDILGWFWTPHPESILPRRKVAQKGGE